MMGFFDDLFGRLLGRARERGRQSLDAVTFSSSLDTSINEDFFNKTFEETAGEEIKIARAKLRSRPFLDKVGWGFLQESESVITNLRGRSLDVARQFQTNAQVSAFNELSERFAIAQRNKLGEHLREQMILKARNNALGTPLTI